VNTTEWFCNSTYEEQMHIAERELAAFISAVTESFGPEQARLSAEDWLEESKLMDSPPRSTRRDWRAVTIAASARLANRLTCGLHDGTARGAPADTKLSTIPSSNYFASSVLM